MSDFQYDVFISYKREDQAFAETLRERLIAWELHVWMDKYNISPGVPWPDAIDEGLRASRVVIGVMSPRAVQSRNVKNEWDWAIVNSKLLIPLMLETCIVPMNYVSLNYIDFTHDHEAGFEKLNATLKTPASVPAPCTDPYRTYLQSLYNRINTYLAQRIIKTRPDDPRTPEPVTLVSERTPGSVDALFEKRDEIDPLFMIGGINQEPIWVEGDFRAAFDYFEGRVLLLGEPGAGKTITLLHFGRDAVVQRIQDVSKPLPVLAIIPTWDAQKQTLLAEWLATSYGVPPDVKEIVREGRALLLLDGLDELGSEREEPDPNEPQKKVRYDPRSRFMRVIPPDNRVVVTCRVKDYQAIGEKIVLNGAVTLRPLSEMQMRDYLREVPDLWTAVENDTELKKMFETPLLMSLFAFAYRDQRDEATQLRDLTQSPGDLRDTIFESYVRKRYEHEERKLKLRKPPETLPFTLVEIYDTLGNVALKDAAYNYQENVLGVNGFADMLDEVSLDIFIKTVIKLHLLTFDREGISDSEVYRFPHLLLRNYFAYGPALRRLRDETLYHYRPSGAGSYSPSESGTPANALGQIGDPRAVEPLIAALKDHNSCIRYSAAIALGQIGDPRAIEPLVVALHDKGLWTLDGGAPDSHGAQEALAKIGQPAIESIIAARAYRALRQIEDVRAVEPLIALLGDSFWDARRSAAEALGRIGDARAVEPLIAALSDSHPAVRVNATEALGKIGDARAVEPLIVALHDGNWTVQNSATEALCQIGVPAVESLIVLLSDSDVGVRRQASGILERIGTPEAINAVHQLHREHSRTRRGAMPE